MLQDEVQLEKTLTSEEDSWDEWGNKLVTWSLIVAITALVLTSLLINLFLI